MTTQNTNGAAQSNGAAMQKFSDNTVDSVIKRIGEFTNGGGVKLPKNYSAENAVRSAWLIIQQVKNLDKRPALEVCTKESIANALLEMVLNGLNPVKKQCYFVVHGNQLTMQRSYIGRIAIGKRIADVKEVRGVPIYKDDVFEYEINKENGRKMVTKHEQKFENIDPAKTIGAYAIVNYNDGTTRTEIMNMIQIRASWEMGSAKGNSPAHKNFTDEMACKTVIARSLKIDVDSTDDGSLFENDDEGDVVDDVVSAYAENEIDQHANKTEIGFDNVEQTPVDTETGEVKQPDNEPVRPF